MSKKFRPRPTARLYYGPAGAETSMYWTVGITNAKKTVTVNGTVAAALRAHPGDTVCCALSNVGMDSAEQFGHPVFFVYFMRSVAFVVDRLAKNGTPVHAVRYGHSYRKLVEANDDGTLKQLVRAKPELIERPFVLRPPQVRMPGTTNNLHHRAVTQKHKVLTVHLHGALRRAVTAGRISASVAEQLSQAMSRQKRALRAVAV